MLVLSEHYERVREYYPFFGFVSVPIVMSERVEMTISKGVLRIGGTIVGGTLGFLVMLHSGLATNPHLLMVRPKSCNQTIVLDLPFDNRPAYEAVHLCSPCMPGSRHGPMLRMLWNSLAYRAEQSVAMSEWRGRLCTGGLHSFWFWQTQLRQLFA